MKYYILALAALSLLLFGCITQEVRACTKEEKLCPDGSAVGRTGPNCEFAPCPATNSSENKHICTAEEKKNIACTLDYNPVCGNDNVTYGNGCGACAAKADSWIRGECPATGAGIANPASVYCIENNGTLEIQDGDEGQIGYCKFQDGSKCEEWAYFRGECGFSSTE